MIRCYITDRHALRGETLMDAIARNLASGPDWIQIREKDLSARELFDVVETALALPNPRGVKILVNTRADVALAAGADGVHLPAGSPAPRRFRGLVSGPLPRGRGSVRGASVVSHIPLVNARGSKTPIVSRDREGAVVKPRVGHHAGTEPRASASGQDSFLIGVSCHSLAEVAAAEAAGADYAVFGPVFTPLSKGSRLPPRGLDGLRRASAAVRIPVLALGGITDANTEACVQAGAAGIAGISLFQDLLESQP